MLKLKNILKSTMCIGLSALMVSPLALINANAQNTTEVVNKINEVKFGGSRGAEVGGVIPIKNGYVTVGLTASTDIEGTVNNGEYDAYIVTFDRDLNITSNKLIGGNKTDCLIDIIKVKDGYVAVGYTDSTNLDGITNKGGNDAWIVKLDNNFNVVKQSSIGGNNNEEFNNLIEVEDGYIALGETFSTDIDGVNNNGKTDILIVKFDKNLNKINHKLIGGTGNEGVRINNLLKTENGFIFNATTLSKNILGLTNNGEDDSLLIEMDNDLNILNKTIFGGNHDDVLYNFIKNDTGYIGIGTTNSTNIEGIDNPRGNISYFVEFDKSLNVIRKKTLPVEENCVYEPYSLVKTKNGYKSIAIKLVAENEDCYMGVSLMDFDNDFNLVNENFERFEIGNANMYLFFFGNDDNYILTGMDMMNMGGVVSKYKKLYKSNDELQVTVEADNSLELALSTNQITFANYNGTEDFINNDLNVTVSSGLNYDLSATMLEEFIPTFDSSATLDSSNLQIKTAQDSNYTPFTTIGDKVFLVTNAPNGKDNVHNINFKLIGDSSVKADTYNTSIKFEAIQK